MAASVPPGSSAARIMLFTGGPCTEGMGKIINKELAEEIRRWGTAVQQRSLHTCTYGATIRSVDPGRLAAFSPL